MRNTIIFLVLMGLMTSMNAQPGTFSSNAESDPEALALLEEIRITYDNYNSASFDFELEMEFPGQGVESQKGNLIQKGEKFVFNLGEQEIYSDTETVWIYDKSFNAVQIYNADFGSDGSFMSPSEFINIYKSEDYSFAIVDKWFEGGKEKIHVDFKPLDDDSEYFKIRLELLGEKHDINSIKVFAKDGSRYTLNIDKMIPNGEYEDEYFVFDTKGKEDLQIENLRID